MSVLRWKISSPCSIHADLAAAQNAAILALSLTPGALSTPDDVSTSGALVS
jgi:hypothetical protein